MSLQVLIEKCNKKRTARSYLTDSQRLEILTILESPSAPSKRSIARKFKVNEKVVRNIWKQRDQIKKRNDVDSYASCENRKRFRPAQYPQLEDQLYDWINAARRIPIPLPPVVIIRKARAIAEAASYKDFQASWGWFRNFRRRKGFGSMDLLTVDPKIDGGQTDLVSSEAARTEVLRSDIVRSVFRTDFIRSDANGDISLEDIDAAIQRSMAHTLMIEGARAEGSQEAIIIRDGVENTEDSVMASVPASGADTNKEEATEVNDSVVISELLKQFGIFQARVESLESVGFFSMEEIDQTKDAMLTINTVLENVKSRNL